MAKTAHDLSRPDAQPFTEYMNDTNTTPANELISKIYSPLKD